MKRIQGHSEEAEGHRTLRAGCCTPPFSSSCDIAFNSSKNCSLYTGICFTDIDLTQALNPESMIPILANSEVQERLVKFLPDGESLPKTEQELRNTVQSPQFQQV